MREKEEDYYNVDCYDKCIGTDEVPCVCGIMVIKGGGTVPGQDLAANGITCYKTNTPVGGRALPLFKSSALVRMDLSTHCYIFDFLGWDFDFF